MRLALTGGDYQARSLAAYAQRCCNLYPVPNPEQASAPFTYYPTAGLRLLVDNGTSNPVRGLYRATNGRLFAVIGPTVYYVTETWTLQSVGTIAALTTPVSMADNGTTLVLVDGTDAGYAINLPTNAFSAISSAAFYGGTRVDYLDTFLLFNKPSWPTFYSSDSNAITFDPLYFANKNAQPDNVVAVVVVHREIWLIGLFTTEVWYNAGGADFPFQSMSGAFIDHGCVAPYSVARVDNSVFWLAQNKAGRGIVLQGQGYAAKRISTYPIENDMQYYWHGDAIGFAFQQMGHTFYVLTFPTGDRTWVYDLATGLWHEWSWLDTNGNERRHRASCHAFAYDINVVGDWETGKLYALDPDVYTDVGNPIKRVRSVPALLNEGKRLMHRQLIADMAVGTDSTGGETPLVSLRWSDTRGATWGNSVTGSLGRQGEYLTSIQWQRLGMSRDRVYELSWSAAVPTALNQLWLDLKLSAT
jgi:hypothetical protein